MRFGTKATKDAVGGILAHTTKVIDSSLPKGLILGEEEIGELLNAGIDTLTVATLDDGDVPENDAANALAVAVVTPGARISRATTGRVNFHAVENGIFWPNREAIDRFNSVDPSITLATLAEGRSVKSGEMVATIKIIPFAVSGTAIGAVLSSRADREVFAVKPYLAHDVALISTMLPALKPSVIEKTTRNLRRRLEDSRSNIACELRCEHRPDALAEQIRAAVLTGSSSHQIIIVFGASAVTDERDVIPEAIRLAGGRVLRVGMPVDPGNLLVLGEVGPIPIVGAPGCARSIKENGFDWVIGRLLVGERPSAVNIAGMGVGGLLKEISTRPNPRDETERSPTAVSVSAVILAAGTSSRMGDVDKHKLLARLDGVPLIRRTALAAIRSKAADVTVVTGHRRDDIERALDGISIALVHNPQFKEGIATSLASGVSSVSGNDPDGILVLLADMPNVSVADIDLLIQAFAAAKGSSVVRATTLGKRGNPVILPRRIFAEVLTLRGDVGAKHVIENSDVDVVDVEIGSAASFDIDTPEALMLSGATFD